MNAENTQPQANLLIVDDLPANLELLACMLKQRGYKVRLAPSGEVALQAARHQAPDLILLDINMPGMNGYEVCERLKADEKLKQIPVIFISALDDVFDKVKAFEVGGVDYVCKPFQFPEVEARVRTHVALRRQERELRENYARLKELERLRDNLVHMIVHDMRSPIAAVLAALEMVQMFPQEDTSTVSQWLTSARAGAKSLDQMTTQLLDISRLESGKMPIKKEMCSLYETLQTAIRSVGPQAQQRQVTLDIPKNMAVSHDQDLIQRVTANLLTNAFKFTTANGVIKVIVTIVKEAARVEVVDNGRGIPEDLHQKIFEKFGQAELRDKRIGTGLGLSFCKLAIEAHGGKIGVVSEPGKGATFWFTLPETSAA